MALKATTEAENNFSECVLRVTNRIETRKLNKQTFEISDFLIFHCPFSGAHLAVSGSHREGMKQNGVAKCKITSAYSIKSLFLVIVIV